MIPSVASDIVERARSGDHDAFEEIVIRIGDRCFGVAYRVVRNRAIAEDAVQRALLAVWRDLPNLRDSARFEQWLYRILLNACYAEIRRQRRWTGTVTQLRDESPIAPDPMVSADDRDALERAFGRLDADRRAIFILHHYAGMTVPAIAEMTGMRPGTIKSRLHYATKILRSALADAVLTELPEAGRS